MTENIVRMGIRPRLKKPKAYLAAWVAPDYPAEFFERLERFKEAGEFKYELAPTVELTYGISSAPRDLLFKEWVIRRRAIHAALIEESDDWLCDFRLAVAYNYWISRFNCRAHHVCIEDYAAGRRPNRFAGMWLQRSMGAAADCLALGWQEEAICLARETAWGVTNQGFIDGDDDRHRRAQYFILRLIADWQGWDLNDLPKCASDEPLYNELLVSWRSEDLNHVAHLLLAACDRHTHQAIPWNVSKGLDADFSDYSMYYNPHEVLAVLRLRQVIGLPNPQLDHVLMNSLIGKLHDPVPMELNDELTAVVSQFRKIYPDL